MTLLVIHLTDAHLDEASTTFCDRAENIVDAALSPFVEVSAVHIVFSGDMANKRAPEDFSVVRKLLLRMKDRVSNRLGRAPIILICAGNHDCDFSGDQSVRDALLTVARSKPQSMSPQILDQIAGTLRGFYDLQAELGPAYSLVDQWKAVAEMPDIGVRYILLNSAVMSTIKEDPGKLFVPLPEIDAQEGVRTFLVMHHPYGWLMPDNARELAQHASMLGDVFLMGHEHELWAQQVSDIYDDSAITYLRGHVLRDSADELNSAFQTILVDPKRGFLPKSYQWKDGRYEPWLEKSKDEFLPWPASNGSRKISLSPSGFQYLNSAGANFTHRKKEVVTLQDIFVWPTLKRVNPEKDTGNIVADGLAVSADFLVNLPSLPPICVIKGGEQAGKSALAKMLTMQLGKRGSYPLLLNASSISSWRPGGLEDRIESAIDQMYGKRWRAEYKRLDPDEKILVIDDFDLLSSAGCLDGLRALRQQFGRVYLMLDSHPGMEVALNEFLRDENFVDSAAFEILPSTHHHRLELIERWLMIGGEPADSIDDVRLTAAKLLKVVDETLGRNLIPAAPIFVLIILQRAELAQDLNTVVKSGSHGFLYESMITQALSSRVTLCNVVTSLTYLTALAKLLDLQGVEDLEQESFEEFHVDHCQRFNLRLSIRSLQGQFVDADILDDRNGRVRFKYPYHYYYFLARRISQISEWGELEPRVDSLVRSIHTERSANLLLFLAHLKRDPRIAEKVIKSASEMFGGRPEADLFGSSVLLQRYKPMDIRQILIEGGRELQLEERAKDERDAEVASREITRLTEERLQARIDDALLMNAAFKTLQVLGQILRNHAGEIEREDKHAMAETCVGLGLRVLSFMFQMVELHGDEMLIFRGLQIKAEKTTLSDAEIARELESYLPSLLSTLTMGTVIKIANAIGSEDLSPTIDDVLKGVNTRRLLRLVAHLEHFSDFPKKELLDFEEDALEHGPVLPNSVLRRFIIRRFYLFPVREELKRSVLQRFKIKALPFQFLEQRRLTKDS